MSKILLNIKANYDKFSKKEEKIADYFLNNPDFDERLTITDLSNFVGVTVSTIVRFTRKMGCDGYREFSIALAKEKGSLVNKSIYSNDPISIMYSKICDDIYASLMKTKQFIDDSVLKEVVDYITSADNIFLYGIGNSHAIALDFYHKLIRLGFNAHVPLDSQLAMISACQSNEKYLFIFISHSGYSEEVINPAEVAQTNGAKIVTVTSNPKSPLSKLSNIVLEASSEEIDYRVLGLTSRYSQLAIFDTIYSYILLKDKNRQALVEDIESKVVKKRLKNNKFNNKK